MVINTATFLSLAEPENPSKTARVLHKLCCGERFNRFEAETWAHDHALNSTISVLANEHRIEIKRQWETVPGYKGKATRCIRYGINSKPENLIKCLWLLKSRGYREPQQSAETLSPTPAEAAQSWQN